MGHKKHRGGCESGKVAIAAIACLSQVAIDVYGRIKLIIYGGTT